MSLFGKTDAQVSRPKNLDVGQVKVITVADGGTGYTNGAAVAVTIAAPPGGGVQAVATANVVGGVVQSITVTNPGAGYTSAPAVSMATGADLDATASIAPVVYDHAKVIFVDSDEAAVVENKARGINSPGWWYVNTYTDANDVERFKAECLVVMSSSVVSGDAGDAADDVLAADFSITFTLQPVDTEATDTDVVELTATVDPVDATLVWQYLNVDTWTDLADDTTYSGSATNTLEITTIDTSLDGTQYRLKATKTGADDTYSDIVTLTVTAA